jgi:hypothetical protein
MKRAVILLVLLLVLLLVPASSRAQVTPPDTARPFVRGGMYDKPHLVNLQGRVAIGGYAEAHARFERVDGLEDESGFLAKRFNMFFNTRVSDIVRLGAELEFEDGGEEVVLEYAAIDVLVHPLLTVRGGMILSPLGRFNLSHDSPLNEFTDRPLVSTDLIGVALSEPGFGVLGQMRTRRTGRITYEAYATNGFHDGLITQSEAGTRIPLGRRNLEDNNASPAVVGRLAWSPRLSWEFGASAHHGAYNSFQIEGTAIEEKRNLTILVMDGEVDVAGVRVMGEAALANIDVPDGLTGIYAEKQRGAYLEAARDFGRRRIATLPQSFFTAKARLDYVDFDTDLRGTSESKVTLGLNFRPTADSAIKLDFVRGRRFDEFNNRGDHAGVLLSIATYF